MVKEEGGAAPVRAAEVITLVLAAFAVEEIVGSTVKVLWLPPSDYGLLQKVGLVGLALLLVLTTIRFYHGNAMHLHERYLAWHHRQLAEGGVITVPLAHAIDTTAHLLEYVALVIAGHLIALDTSIKATGIAVIALFGIDVIWTLVSKPSGPDHSSHHLHNWLVTNSITIGALILVLALLPEGWFAPSLASVLLLNTAWDYKKNYEHYFSSLPTPRWVSTNQAGQTLQHLLAFIYLVAKLDQAGPPTPGSERQWLQEQLQRIFFFMGEDELRRDLFQRRGLAGIHAAVYLKSGDDLCPIFRWAPATFHLHNRRFPQGRSFIGLTFSQLRDKPESATIYDTYTDPAVPKEDVKERDSHFYKSSLMANIFWPPGVQAPEAVGIVVVTSDREQFFTRKIHEPLAIGLARVVALTLRVGFPGRDWPDIVKDLSGLIARPIVVTVKGE